MSYYDSSTDDGTPKMCGANSSGANRGLNVRRTAPQSSVTQCKETNFRQFYHIIVWVLFHLWRRTSHDQLGDANCKTLRPLFIGERATPYSASCSQGNVIMDTGWLSSQEQHWTGPLFDNKCGAFMTFSEATDTLHSCNFTHQKAQSLLDDSHFDYRIIIKKNKTIHCKCTKKSLCVG